MNLKATETILQPAAMVDSVAVLLRGLIDYAGLFPPASLAMSAAVANYDAYGHAEYSWILGRFIVPVARLGEFERELCQIARPNKNCDLRWPLSVLLGTDAASDVARIRDFNRNATYSETGKQGKIESVEVRITKPEEISHLSEIIPAELETYFEIPLSGRGTTELERECVAAAAATGRRSKIRTGGETADKFPSSESVAEFIGLCGAENVAFKATAGLHHPLRSVHRFTYQPESPSGMMHGFLNVFLTAAFLRAGLGAAPAIELLNEQSAEAFHFDSEGARWRGHQLSVGQIAAARRGFSISFGSCSFTEPIDDLRALHLL
jgi:hypothetical protein